MTAACTTPILVLAMLVLLMATWEFQTATVLANTGIANTLKETIVRQKNIDVLIDNRDRTVSYVKPEWDVTADFTKAINDQVK